MGDNVEQDQLPEVMLVSEQEQAFRPLFNEFYGHLRNNTPHAEVYGPSALTDSSFDRMMHERTVLGFLVGRLATRGALESVLQDAAIREKRPVSPEELPNIIVKSLIRVRQTGEWDNDPKLRMTRKELIIKATRDHADYPLIAEAIQLNEMLRFAGHEAYALDAIAATSKWLERLDKLHASDQSKSSSARTDPAA